MDLTVILVLTTVTVRLLSGGLIRSLDQSRNDAREIGKQTAQLKGSEERFRALFEGANDAILIMRDELFIDCNSMTMNMFGCKQRSDIVGHFHWYFSPRKQPDGSVSKDKASEIIYDALQGTPQLEDGASDFVQKPCSPILITKKIREVLAQN